MFERKFQKQYLLLICSIILFSVITSSSFAQSDNWIYKTKMPTGRTFLSACVLDGKIYAIGGAPNYSGTSAVEMYDPQTDTWTPKANLPSARCAPTTCTFNGKIYEFGGSTAVLNSPGNKNVYLYDPQADTWTQKKDMPYAIKDCGIAVVDSLIYFIGGRGGPSDSSVIVYNPISESWTQRADMPTPRGMLSSCVFDGKIYAIGGTSDDWENVFYNNVEVYDPAADTWIQKPDMPTGRWGLTACTLNGLIYAIGGRAGRNSSSKVEVYDPSTDTWTTKTSLQRSRTTLAVGVVGNKIYAMGGHISPNFTILSSVEEYTSDATGIDSEHKSSSIPKEFQLNQNYPNPFNPSTIIKFDVPALREGASEISLAVFNLLGQKVATLFAGAVAAGTYEAKWNGLDQSGNQVPSGVYVYRIVSENYSQSKRMTLVK